MSTPVSDHVDYDAYIDTHVGICFWLFLVNVVAISCNPAWQHLCCKSKLRCWRHIKTWPPPWPGGCTANKDVEEGAAADGAKEDALHDTSIWGWHGLDGRHITDGLLGQWGMLLLRTLEVILFLFTMIFQAAAPAHVATNDYDGLSPGWLTYLTNWTFLLFGAQAALGWALVIVELCRRLPCLRDASLFSSSYGDAQKPPTNHLQRLPFPAPPDPAPDPKTAADAVTTRPPPPQAAVDGSCSVTPAAKPHPSHTKEAQGSGSRCTSPAPPVLAPGHGDFTSPPVSPMLPQIPRLSSINPVRQDVMPRPPNAPGTSAPSAPPAPILRATPPSSSPPSPSALASHASNSATLSDLSKHTPATTHTHHTTTTHSPHMYLAARPSTAYTDPAGTAAQLALPPQPAAPHAPHTNPAVETAAHRTFPTLPAPHAPMDHFLRKDAAAETGEHCVLSSPPAPPDAPMARAPHTNPTAEAAARFASPPPAPPAVPFPPPPPAPAIIPEEAVESNGTSHLKKESTGEHSHRDHCSLRVMMWHIKGPGYRHWLEPFMPSTDDSLPPRPLNFFEKTYLLLYQTTFVASLIVTIFFWGARAGSDVHASSVLKHGAHAFAMLLDLSLSRMPAVAFHIVVAFWYSILYSIFMFIYQIEMWRYQLVRWDDRLSPLAYVVLYLVIMILYMIMFGIVHLRDWLILTTRRYLAQPAR
ncbi:hypothetical protein DUNSADRAFT_6407 [Dunaliella salina]|uniref:Uncharacterized protein n=1 Tax=Dunaliella salina TaxID=3046 RepID=A0ABQ7H6S2_DUNSA|nr:hypothetical protein DUNSADRAFT_6407 [Dunaliella salina]|eukprot:KAF5842557.1 hypothetical protein DUNSADRAFT_6407 [Dunaliella salina]